MSRLPARWALEAFVVVALALSATWYGRFAFLNSARLPDFYWLAPATMVASGQGFQNPVPVPGSALADFLTQRTSVLSFASVTPARVKDPDLIHDETRYLLLVIGYWWKVVGISWAALADVAAILHLLTVIGTYATLRLLLPLPFAAVGAWWVCTSTLPLSVVPHLRDYSKGSFILIALPLVILLALRAGSRRTLLALSAITGVVIGVGFGFRMDVAVMAPIAIGCIWFFCGRRPWTNLEEKVQATLVLTLALLISAGPILYKLSSGGSNAFHVILLGYAEDFDTSLGIEASVYGFLPFYNDKYLEAAIQAYGETAGGPPLELSSVEYDRVSRRLWLDIVRRFPADVFARMLAATSSVLNLIFTNPAPSFLSRPLPAQDSVVKVFLGLHQWNNWGGALGVSLVVVAFLVGLREGLLGVALLLALAGYPSLQFSTRHYFHLQVIPVLALLVLVRIAILAPFWIGRDARAWRSGEALNYSNRLRQSGPRLAAAMTILVLATMLPLEVLRAYQSRRVGSLILGFLQESHTKVDAEFLREKDDLWLARWPGVAGSVRGVRESAYYVLEFHSEGPSRPIAVGLRYRSPSFDTDFSRVLSVSSEPGVARLGFPVFGEVGQWEFEGVELGRNVMSRLIGIYRVSSRGPEGLPVDLRIPAGWSSRPLFQRLIAESRTSADPSVRPLLVVAGHHSQTEQVTGLDRLWSQAFLSVAGRVDVTHGKSVSIASTTIRMDGIVESESSYLVEFKPANLGIGAALVAQGRLEKGGVAIGLLKDNAWYAQAVVQQQGDFAVVVPVTDAGTYVPLVTNAMPPGDRHNRFLITRIDLVPADPLSHDDAGGGAREDRR